MHTTFNNEMIWAEFHQYGENDTLRLDFNCNEGPYITLSTNLSIKVKDDEIFIKQDCTHLELANHLCETGDLVPTVTLGKSGYNTYRLYKITGNLAEEQKKQSGKENQ